MDEGGAGGQGGGGFFTLVAPGVWTLPGASLSVLARRPPQGSLES